MKRNLSGTTHYRFLAVLSGVFAILFASLAITPHSREDWALENALVVLLVLLVAATYRKFPLSRVSYGLIFVFLCIHEIGAHYTYSLVPYDKFLEATFGTSLDAQMGWQRNQFDRMVHFAYGLLLAYPLREFYCRVADSKGFWGYFFPLELTMATSMLYELIEWGAAAFFGGELGAAYLGTQGDIWDAHKDMALASCGALTAMTITFLVNWQLQRNFSEELSESLSIKHNEPLGEDEISRMLHADDPVDR